MKFDDVLQNIGEFGLYQKRLLLLMCINGCCVIIQNLSPVFTIKIPRHRCKIPDHPNDTYEIQNPHHAFLVNQTIPTHDDGYSTCTLYDVRRSDDVNGDDNRTEIPCSQWVYDKSVFSATLVTELDLVCDRKIYRSHSSMMIFAGKFVGAFLNSIGGDYFGRRRVYTFMLVALVGTSVGIVFVSNLASLMAFRFMAGAFTTGSYLCVYVISVELMGPRYRRFVSITTKASAIVAMLTANLFAYFLRDWQHFQAALATPVVFVLIGYFFLPESPRWLVSKGRYEEATKVLQAVARANGRSLPRRFETEALAALASANAPSRSRGKPGVSPLSLFRIPRLCLRYTFLYICWILIVMCSYGLMLSVSNMSGNIFLNFGIMSSLDIVSFLVVALLVERVGRRSFIIVNIGVGGAACLATILPVLLGGDAWIPRGLSLAGRMFVSSTFSALYILSPELFPTVLRSFGLGSCSMMSRIGGLASPYVADLNTYISGTFGEVLPQIAFGASGLLMAILMFFLPETKGRHLPETVRDAELFGRQKVGHLKDIDIQLTTCHPDGTADPVLKR